MKHKLVFLFSYHQFYLQIVLLLCSFHKVLHSCMALDCTLHLQKLKTFKDGPLPPSLLVSMARQFLHWYIVERTCASVLGVLIPSLIMTYCVALNKAFNLIYKMGTTITSSGGYGEEQRIHIRKDTLQTAKGYRNIN